MTKRRDSSFVEVHRQAASFQRAPTDTWKTEVTESRWVKVACVTSPDRYLLELGLDYGQYRGVHEVRGGRHLGLLLC